MFEFTSNWLERDRVLSLWSPHSRWFRQIGPLPLTVLSILNLTFVCAPWRSTETCWNGFYIDLYQCIVMRKSCLKNLIFWV